MIILNQKVTSYRVFVDNEGAPAVTLARVLAGVRGADHAVGDLAALVACGLTRCPAAAKTGYAHTVHVYPAVSPADGVHPGLLQNRGLRSSKGCGTPSRHYSRLVVISLKSNIMLTQSLRIVAEQDKVF